MFNELFFNGIIIQGLNNTKKKIIPKKDKPTNILQFRAIGLCKVIYKRFYKVSCHRLKKFHYNVFQKSSQPL